MQIAQILRDHQEAWRQLVELNLERARELYRQDKKDVALTINAMIADGECTICGIHFQPVVVKNQFADYTYYKPSCKCYPVCWHCSTQIVEHKLLEPNIKTCPNCKVSLYYRPDMPSYQVEDALNEAAKGIEISYHPAYIPRQTR